MNLNPYFILVITLSLMILACETPSSDYLVEARKPDQSNRKSESSDSETTVTKVANVTEPAVNNNLVNGKNLTGTYIADFSSRPPLRMKQKLILNLNQHGNLITASDSENTLRLSGELKGDVIDFEIRDSIGASVNQHPTFGQWAILNEGNRLEGNLRGKGGPYDLTWNLRRIDNHGVELYTIETGLNRSFIISESEKIFDRIFSPTNNQNVVFLIHGRGKDFEEEFDSSMIPYTEMSSNTRFIIISWLSWGEARIRPYQHAANAAPGLYDFLLAFNEYKSRKPDTVGDRNITLLAHSMGNIPLKILLEELYAKQVLQRGLLSSVILSSADVPIAGHREWVEKIDFADKIHIIQNQRDLILSLSALIDKDTPGGEGPKLGRGFDSTTYTHIEDLANNAHYLDVTRSASIDHRTFNMSSYPMDANATRLFKLLLNGQGIDHPDPSIGLYQKPDLSPVFYFYSSKSLGEKSLVETEKDQAERMTRYIELRANQFYSEDQRRPEVVQLNTSENVYRRTGDWRPAKGEWQTIWRVRSGTEKARLKIIDDTRVAYDYKNGRMFFHSIDKQGKWDGYWVEDSGSTPCANGLKDGSRHWGKIMFQFNDNYTSFEGKWDYCGQGKKSYWNGYR